MGEHVDTQPPWSVALKVLKDWLLYMEHGLQYIEGLVASYHS
jgi:hypothetical protein